MARPNMKSVRLSDEALAIVNSAPGEGFNDKFEKLIISYERTIPTRTAHLEAIEKRIAIRVKKLEELNDLEEKVNFLIRQLFEISKVIPKVAETLNNVSQN